jgi:hypothetical protein
MKSMNGWLRLWVLCSAIWAAVAAVGLEHDFHFLDPKPSIESIERHLSDSSLNLRARASAESQAALDELYRSRTAWDRLQNPIRTDEWSRWEDRAVDGVLLSAPKGLDDATRRVYERDYVNAYRKASWGYRLDNAPLAFATLFGPSLAILLLGLGIAWVRKGFRSAPA